MLVREQTPAAHFSLQKRDIAEDEQLMEKYSLSIPVLEKSGSEHRLYWPFDRQQLALFLRQDP